MRKKPRQKRYWTIITEGGSAFRHCNCCWSPQPFTTEQDETESHLVDRKRRAEWSKCEVDGRGKDVSRAGFSKPMVGGIRRDIVDDSWDG
jgi:hypothetical protein